MATKLASRLFPPTLAATFFLVSIFKKASNLLEQITNLVALNVIGRVQESHRDVEEIQGVDLPGR